MIFNQEETTRRRTRCGNFRDSDERQPARVAASSVPTHVAQRTWWRKFAAL